MDVAVVGAGYVGGVTAAGLAAWGHRVRLFDLDRGRAEALVAGRPAIHEPGLERSVAEAAGRLSAAGTLREALFGATVAMICVDTPAESTGAIDLTRVERAVRDVVGAANGPLLVVIRSTVVPGTADRIDREVGAPARESGQAIEIASNPEFLREGRAVADFRDPDRIVVGAASEGARAALEALYRPFADRVLVMSRSSAELAKYANNALLAMLVSFSNELASIAEAVPGADVTEALLAVHADRRWRGGEGAWDPGMLSYLWPGCGYGGSCLPKDVKALVAEAERRGVATPLITAVDEVNDAQASRLADRIAELLPLEATRVAVLGTAFKEGTNDLRGSPGLAVAEALRARGAEVATFDPLLDPSDALGAALVGARAWVVVTWAAEFAGLAERAQREGVLLVDARRRFGVGGAGGYLGPGRC